MKIECVVVSRRGERYMCYTCWLHQNQADTEIEYKTQRLKII